MPQFLLSVHHDDNPVYSTPEEMEQAYADTGKVNAAMVDEGVFVFAGGLQASTTATVIHLVDGGTERVAGPALQADQHIGGFWVLECPDMESALQWAERGAVACRGDVEVRPFHDMA